MKGVVIGGTASGVGKTIATLAVIHALEATGYTVQPAKAGPDFIDPSHHAALTGRPSRTLDPWLQGPDGLRRNYHRGTGDVCVVEGVMGLFDGDHPPTARVAAILDLPVILVIDASACRESAAATALGFREYAARQPDPIDVTGVILQHAHPGRHADPIVDALPDDLNCYGVIPPIPGLEIPDRHLGLHSPEEAPIDPDTLRTAAEHLDPTAIARVARNPPPPDQPAPDPRRGSARVAVANDSAFRFIYPAVRERIQARATLVPFSPTAGDPLPGCDAVYLPGGYPELHAAALAESPATRDLREQAADGLPVFGECGGMMVLAESLTTTGGTTHPMAGVLPAHTRMHDRFQALDHTELTARTTTRLALQGATRRAHEFHYSSAETAPDAAFAFDVTRGSGIDGNHDGLTEYDTIGTYCHFHAERGVIDAFLDSL